MENLLLGFVFYLLGILTGFYCARNYIANKTFDSLMKDDKLRNKLLALLQKLKK